MPGKELTVFGYDRRSNGESTYISPEELDNLKRAADDITLTPYIDVLGTKAIRFAARGGRKYDLLLAPQKYNNSGKTFKFKKRYNPLTETHGWVPEHIPNFDPVNGGMVIHDIMEHLPGNEYGVAQEYIAQGAVVALRYMGRYWGIKSDGNPADIPSSHTDPAFDMLFKHLVRGDLDTESCPMHPMCMIPLDPPAAESQLFQMLTRARIFMEANHALNVKRLESSMTQALGWMRLGFRLTKKRYEGMDLPSIAAAFKESAQVVDKITSNSEDGDMLTIQPFPEKAYIQITHVRKRGPGSRVVVSDARG
jgi:hypothetical protein